MCLVLGTGSGAPGPLGHQLRDSRLYGIKGKDGWRPLPLGAFTCDRCSGEITVEEKEGSGGMRGGFPRWEGKAEQQCCAVSQLVKVCL